MLTLLKNCKTLQSVEIWSKHQAYWNCIKSNNAEWQTIHKDNIFDILATILPHGSGIDSTWHIEILPNRIDCHNSFHCMNENGFYCGWIDFTLSLKPNNELKIKGNFKRDPSLKDYLYDLFGCWYSEYDSIVKAFEVVTYHSDILPEIQARIASFNNTVAKLQEKAHE